MRKLGELLKVQHGQDQHLGGDDGDASCREGVQIKV